jgi:alanyl-tRNA synthetase
MTTFREYEVNVTKRESLATILECRQREKTWELLLDRTLFFPEGGGQPCDLGRIQDWELEKVYEEEGEIWHQISVPAHSTLPVPGQEVQLILDWERRFDHMQRHLGEHIISGVFYHLFGGVNRGFHMGQEDMTIDISLEENPGDGSKKPETLTWEMVKTVETMANEIVWENLPVTTVTLESREEAQNFPLRKALAIDEDIRIVCVGTQRKPADCVACCGTHPPYTGHVGLIKIWKLENYKGMYRIHLDAGKRAYNRMAAIYQVAQELGVRYSAQPEELKEKIEAWEEKNQTIRNELHHIKQSLISQRQEEIQAHLNQEILIREYDDLKSEDLLKLGRGLIPKIPFLLLLIATKENTLLLFSNGKKIDCNKLVKENAPIYQGKGGGNKESARAIFPGREGLETYIDLLEKHLR